jgi:hypothetical protein
MARSFSRPLIIVALVVCGGCSASSETTLSESVVNTPPPPTVGIHHEHPTEGPHGGDLIELGHDHKYHAELLQDDVAQTVIVYTLDEQFRELSIAEQVLTLHLTASDQPKTFELQGETDGRQIGCSKFVSADASLLQMLAGGTRLNGKLRVTIDGVPYVGRIASRDSHAHRD